MKTNLKSQLKSFDFGYILDYDGNTDEWSSNFYDWFCRDSSLESKATKLFPIVEKFVEKFGVDTENTYVFFKNNCPMVGKLYDDFRICDMEGDVIWTVVPKSGHTGKGAEIWGSVNGFDGPFLEGKTLNSIYKTLDKK